MEEGNPGTDSPNLDGDPEFGDPEAGEPETGYHEYEEIVPEETEGSGFDNYRSVDLNWHYTSTSSSEWSLYFQANTISSQASFKTYPAKKILFEPKKVLSLLHTPTLQFNFCLISAQN